MFLIASFYFEGRHINHWFHQTVTGRAPYQDGSGTKGREQLCMCGLWKHHQVILIHLDLEGGEDSKLMTWESACLKLKKQSLFESAHNSWHKDCMYKEMHISGNVVHVY